MDLFTQIKEFEEKVESEVKQVLSEFGYNTESGDITRVSVVAPDPTPVVVAPPTVTEVKVAPVEAPTEEATTDATSTQTDTEEEK